MRADDRDPQAAAEPRRDRGADRMRLRVIEALARRASAHEGHTRRLIDERLASRVAAHERQTAEAAARTVPQAHVPAGSGLGALADVVGRHAQARVDIEGTPSRAYPEMHALDYFRQLWSRLRVERQLRQSLQDVPEDAGPLNSGRLVHRALTLLSGSPYLPSLLSYVETLAWMERMGDDGLLPEQAPPHAPAAATGKRGRARTRGA